MSEAYNLFVRRFYMPLTWYWIADDGRIFSSRRQMIVPPDDPEYMEFCTGGPATAWPRDANGDQTDTALQQVFDMLNIQQGGVPQSAISVHSTAPAKPQEKINEL